MTFFICPSWGISYGILYIEYILQVSKCFLLTHDNTSESHHSEPLTLADHAHELFGVRDPVFAGRGLVWRLKFGRRATFSPR